jgi:hypothetical protein
LLFLPDAEILAAAELAANAQVQCEYALPHWLSCFQTYSTGKKFLGFDV